VKPVGGCVARVSERVSIARVQRKAISAMPTIDTAISRTLRDLRIRQSRSEEEAAIGLGYGPCGPNSKEADAWSR